MKFDYYSDTSHGWLKVTRKKLESLGVSGQISSCSYQRNNHVYLEEDVDAGIFIEALKSTGKTVEFREHHTDKRSRIRGYDMYVNTNVSFPTPTPKKVEKSGNYALVYRPTFDEKGWENEDKVYEKVYVGDYVCFKSDHEQSGKVIKIIGSGRSARLVLHDADGFSGDYLRYATETQEDASDCWI